MKLTQVSVLTGRLRHPPSGKLPVQMVIVVVASYFACISRCNDNCGIDHTSDVGAAEIRAAKARTEAVSLRENISMVD